jgi:cellulose synthase/poly-beta-1,6-N-acetylglucosamine synthase-like glycosyltransferase
VRSRHPASGFALAASAVFVVVGGTALFLHLLREHLDIEGPFMRATAGALLAFLGILLLRYVLLLWFAFLNHVEAGAELAADHEPLVSIVVPAFNEERVIDSVIRSLAELNYSRYEIIIVDDGSSDGTYRRALALTRGNQRVAVRTVSQRNAGKARALQHGITVAGGAYVLCVDSDSVLAPDSLRAAMRHFRDPAVGAVAGNIKVSNRVNLLTWLQALEYVEGLNLARSAQAFFRIVNIVPGPLGVFRREAIVGAGGHSGDTYAEDCDLTLALLERGWKIKYEPRAIAYTEAPERFMSLMKQRYRWTRGILQALRKHRGSRPGGRTTLGARITVAYMLFEAVAWPVMNVVANVFLVTVALRYGFSRLLVLWWLELTLLDAVGALFSVAAEGEDFRLVPFALLYRVSYTLLIDIAKCLASVEELMGRSMTWGKLERVGRLP